MRQLIYLKLFLFPLMTMLLSSCPATNTNDLGDGITHRDVRGRVDAQGQTVMDGMCPQGRRCQDSPVDPNRLNRWSVLGARNPCQDGNCPPGHTDRTPSTPRNTLDVPGFTPWSEELSAEVRRYVNVDNAPVGYCGRGVHNIITRKLCIRGVEKRDGHQWDNMLAGNPNFREVNCSPTTCPPGTILTYEHETPRPRNPPAGQKGRRYGHVEFVTSDGRGGKTYCSSHCQRSWGGSVPHTRRRAFVYIGGNQCRE